MSFTPLSFLSVGLATLAAFVTVLLMIKLNVKDSPDSRSSHKHVTPTSGGLAVVAALLVMSIAGGGESVVLLACVLVIASLGLYDDIHPLNPALKLTVMMGVALVTAYHLPPISKLQLTEIYALTVPAWLGMCFACIWIIVLMNAVNFMDGSNGMLVCLILPAAISLTVLSYALGSFISAWAIALVIGLAVFGLFNVRRSAKIFAGDAGSLSVGYSLAVTSLNAAALIVSGQAPYWLAFLIWPILLDVFLTLLRRARAGKALGQAHNEHLYQRYIQTGRSHLSVSLIYGLISTACIILGAVLMAQPIYVLQIGLVLMLILSVVIYLRLYKKAMNILAS